MPYINPTWFYGLTYDLYIGYILLYSMSTQVLRTADQPTAIRTLTELTRYVEFVQSAFEPDRELVSRLSHEALTEYLNQ